MEIYTITKKGLIFFSIFVYICAFITGILTYKEYNKYNINYNVSIPSDKQIKRFCQKLGYDYGWLSSTSCEVNEVQCYEELGLGMNKVSCINWNIKDGVK